MPKLSFRCNRRGNHVTSHSPATSFGVLAPPRKVSFEETQQQQPQPQPTPSSGSPSDVHEPLSNILSLEGSSTCSAPLSRKPTMIRPKSSISLVELAKRVEEEDENRCDNTLRIDTTASSSSNVMGLDAKAGVAPVSPIVTSSSSWPEDSDRPVVTSPSSPWGYFVDMVIPSYDEAAARTSAVRPHSTQDAPHSCCSASRRRRANAPYGEYKKTKQQQQQHQHRSSTTSSPLDLDLDIRRSFPSSRRRSLSSAPKTFIGNTVAPLAASPSFRLMPRGKDPPTEQLIDPFRKLQVDWERTLLSLSWTKCTTILP